MRRQDTSATVATNNNNNSIYELDAGESNTVSSRDDPSRFVSCPLCGKHFARHVINDHVNGCLDLPRSAPAGSTTATPSSQHINKRKRKLVQVSVGKPVSPAKSFCTTDSSTASFHKDDCDSNNTQYIQTTGNTTTKQTFSIKDGDHLSATKANSRNPSARGSDGDEKQTHNANPTAKPFSKNYTPLADAARPQSLDMIAGHEQLLGEGSLLRRLIEADQIPNMILWGPPGCGKTSVGHVIAHATKSHFVSISAATSNVSEIKGILGQAIKSKKLLNRKTILFLDEIHRFNKLQQDSLLQHVENGTITLVGATTQNPSFECNPALLSRCRVFVLKKLTTNQITTVLKHATNQAALRWQVAINIQDDAYARIANSSDGDARHAINTLEMVLRSQRDPDKYSVIKAEDIDLALQERHISHDKGGEQHYDLISAMHKSIRGSDPNATVYWLVRMLEGGESPLFIARRLVRAAAEDIGLADPSALSLAVACFQACHLLGMPECDCVLGECAVYLANAPKSVAVYKAVKNARSLIKNCRGPLPSVPMHIRNAPTTLMKDLGYGRGYIYNPDHQGEEITQSYLPEELCSIDLFKND